jgi:glycosyltransferase involved in cell wall biosynthesis
MGLQVSILVNNYNYGHFLMKAIDSALAQTYPICEVIVVDDGSTDRSQTVIESYGDRVLSLFQANGGQASAFNAGFAKSKGDIICFLDADDFFAPTKAAEIAAIFTADPEIQWCFHPLILVDEGAQNVLVQPSPFLSARCDVRQGMQNRGTLKGQLPALIPATSGLCFRRSLLAEIFPMPEAIRITSDDYLKFTAVGISPGYFSASPLAFQRIHGNNAYTHNPRQNPVKARVSVATAYWMNDRFPRLWRFADNLLAVGLGLGWSLGTPAPEVAPYLAPLPWLRKLKINLKALYHFLNYRLRSRP